MEKWARTAEVVIESMKQKQCWNDYGFEENVCLSACPGDSDAAVIDAPAALMA